MHACETMGGANCVCSDKTGTLTQNKMNLQQIWNQNIVQIDVYSKSMDMAKFIPQSAQDNFLKSCIVNSSSNIYPAEDGSATDIALLRFSDRCGVNIAKYRQDQNVVHNIPFSSTRKRMSTVIEEDGKKVMYIKGASEIILDSCNSMIGFDGNTQNMDANLK